MESVNIKYPNDLEFINEGEFTGIYICSMKVGYFSLKNLDYFSYFDQISINTPGIGIGGFVYHKVMDDLSSVGRSLRSDPESFSLSAYRLWNSLERKNLAYSVGFPIVDDYDDVRGIDFYQI